MTWRPTSSCLGDEQVIGPVPRQSYSVDITKRNTAYSPSRSHPRPPTTSNGSRRLRGATGANSSGRCCASIEPTKRRGRSNLFSAPARPRRPVAGSARRRTSSVSSGKPGLESGLRHERPDLGVRVPRRRSGVRLPSGPVGQGHPRHVPSAPRRARPRAGRQVRLGRGHGRDARPTGRADRDGRPSRRHALDDRARPERRSRPRAREAQPTSSCRETVTSSGSGRGKGSGSSEALHFDDPWKAHICPHAKGAVSAGQRGVPNPLGLNHTERGRRVF